MDAVKFLKEKNRMCESYQSCSAGCPLTEKCGNDFCDDYCKEDPSGAVAVVEKWSSEHPANTRQSEFLKMFPNVERLPDGCIALCPHKLDLTFNLANCSTSRCGECKRGFWLAEVE